MAPKALPAPPRPDPVTLDQIVTNITTPGIPLDVKAYHLVALNTVAFHPSVKIFLFEDPNVAAGNESSTVNQEVARTAFNRARRELILRNIAFFLAQRNNAICEECRWETVSLLGELCRMEGTHTSGGHSNGGSAAANASSPQEALDVRLRDYARSNLEYLAMLPWFPLAVNALLGQDANGADGVPGPATVAATATASSTAKSDGQKEAHTPRLSREELKQKLREKRAERASGETLEKGEVDEDVLLALRDIKNALPIVEGEGAAARRCVWTPEAITQAHDLMFLDASTSLLHLIPTVSRCYSDVCAMCLKHSAPLPPTTAAATSSGSEAAPKRFLRCSNCKAVYYCSAECQRKHWATSHRQPCKSFADRSDYILEQYYKVNAGRAKKGCRDGDGGVAVLEVPLEPSLFFETRRYLFDHRDSSFDHVNFYDYFMKYTVRGS